ncbi:thiamine pyrophosphate-binding protein [Dankookia sp. P2]|uniref:thiamine pyrophosphate-binding protein n=1 Tax=Dankookia sp. P2 TaxID=3423955 RepID=UPI003D67AD01
MPQQDDTITTGAGAVAEALQAAGVPRLYGVPGGGSSLDLIEAAAARGIPFVLARQESAAVIMAATEAELSHRPGAVVVTRGPGVGNAANGMAQASLDRAPLLLLADGFTGAERAFANHQFFDHAGMLAPVTKAAARAAEPGGAPGAVAATLLETALTAPRGPVLLELSAGVARGPAAHLPAAALAAPDRVSDSPALEATRTLLRRARRPVLVAGLEANRPDACDAFRALAARLGCPVLVTYKAKGVLPDADPLFAGVFTGGEAEAPVLREADLIILAGADPVEFIPQPWRFTVPIIDIGTAPRPLHYRAPAAALYGPLAPALAALIEAAAPGAWDARAIAAHRTAWLTCLANAPGGNQGLSPQAVVEMAQAACRAAGRDPRISVDAGAHMFPCTSFWQAERPGDLLISNGLATMGFALPAGIAAALHDPDRGALAFTGDGGLLMALGELATATALGVKLTIIVFNDATLSLIDIKKGGRDLPGGALGWPMADFAGVMRSLGGIGLRAADEAGYRAALAEALATPGPALVDARVDPGSYPAQIKALRG